MKKAKKTKGVKEEEKWEPRKRMQDTKDMTNFLEDEESRAPGRRVFRCWTRKSKQESSDLTLFGTTIYSP